ncbi:PepSY-associated TM helix domain-containing protein [Asticcacaulis sp. W401b]|uniref:PepSY-associated TM helix domain-containing protein n=1 Tax=Asticcacaulis sp. W401b TaxID=3388666 RepID=UPI003970521F
MSARPLWPRIPAGFVRAVLAGHSALGLAFAALIYLVCFSGALAVFTDEFRRWENPGSPRVTSITPDLIDKAFGQTLERAPWAHHVFITLPTEDLPQMRVMVQPDHEDHARKDKTWMVDAEGNLTTEVVDAWTNFQAYLHTRLHLPGMWGGFLVGLTGVALLSSLVSGVLSHPRVFKDAFAFRMGSNKRLQEADLHNRVGIWGLPFHLLVSLTGAFLGLTTLIVGVLALAVYKGDVEKAYALFTGPHPVDDPRPAPRPNLNALLMDLQTREPDARVTYIMIEHPGEEGASVSVSAQTPHKLSRGEMHVYDRKAVYLGNWGWEKGTAGQKIYSALSPLHFGWFGGWAIKLVYGVLGLGLAAVTSSGVAIWLARRRDKGRPAPIFERLWAATVWSQPFAYALTAGLALITRSDTALIPLWLGITVASLWLAALVPAKPISVGLRLATAAGLIGTVGIHLVLLLSFVQADPVVWFVDCAVALMACALVVSTLWSSTSPHGTRQTG